MIVDDLFESPQTCPECGGPAFSDLLLAEKKDACYNKVRSRYKVWPSAYASGALVQCRKKGAANWGNKSKNESVAEGASNIGNSIKALYQKIYRAGDDEVEYFYNDSPIFAQYWDEYEGDLDSIVAEVDPSELQIMLDELESYVQQANLAEADYSPMAKDSMKADKIRSLENLIAIAREQGRQLRVQELELELKKLQGVAEEQLDEKCWDTHKQVGMKNKGGRMVPNCVPKEGIEEGGNVFMSGIQNTPEYKAGFSTGKLPVPHPEGSQEYASYYKGVMDKAGPKVSEGDNEKIGGRYDADEFDAMVSRLKKLAGQGPMRTVYDPNTRRYKNVPVAQQTQDKK